MLDEFSRTRRIFGSESMNLLSNAHIIVFGIGGVGSYVAEALVRCGVGKITLVDNDVVSITNINRQLYALHSTIGKYKVDIAAQRICDINPNCQVFTNKTFFTPETSEVFDFSLYDYVADCIDTVSGKIQIVQKALESRVPVISCMGTGNKINPSMLEVSDISKTSVCPLARVMRKELKKRGIEHLKVVYSKEKPCSVNNDLCEEEANTKKKYIPASCSFVPSVAGLLISSEIVKDITGFRNN